MPRARRTRSLAAASRSFFFSRRTFMRAACCRASSSVMMPSSVSPPAPPAASSSSPPLPSALLPSLSLPPSVPPLLPPATSTPLLRSSARNSRRPSRHCREAQVKKIGEFQRAVVEQVGTAGGGFGARVAPPPPPAGHPLTSPGSDLQRALLPRCAVTCERVFELHRTLRSVRKSPLLSTRRSSQQAATSAEVLECCA